MLAAVQDHSPALSTLAHYLANVATAWREASQEQRNKLAKTLFEEIWVEDKRVVAVKPRPEFEPFFKLNFDCHIKSIAGDPGGIRALIFNTSKSAFSQYCACRRRLASESKARASTFALGETC